VNKKGKYPLFYFLKSVKKYAEVKTPASPAIKETSTLNNRCTKAISAKVKSPLITVTNQNFSVRNGA
jgi:hypothetical protein